jgi:hypothetical protein
MKTLAAEKENIYNKAIPTILVELYNSDFQPTYSVYFTIDTTYGGMN